MEDKKRTASDAIFAFLDWFEESMVHNDYERGVQFGLMIAIASGMLIVVATAIGGGKVK